jgi:hypothetical protein
MTIRLAIGLLVGCPSSHAVLVTYEVTGTVRYGGDGINDRFEVLDTGVNGGPNQYRVGSSYVGQPMRLVFTYDTETFATTTADNDDMTEYTYSVASGLLMVGGDLISRFSIGSVAQAVNQPNGLFVGAGESREGAAAELVMDSLLQFRPDGRFLPPGGWLSLTSPNDGMGAGILIARPGDLMMREVVPEPSSAVLAGLAAVALFSRRSASVV